MTKRIQSPTSINTYLRCPRKYYLKYILGLKEKPNIYLIRGQAVHHAIARLSRRDMKDPVDFDNLKMDLLKLFEEYWLSQEKEIQLLGLGKETLEEIYHEGTEMMAGWLIRYIKDFMSGQKELEIELKLISETHGVMGFIDAVRYQDGKVLLVDYKTSKSEDMTRDIKVQMAIYALLFKENFKVLPDSIIIDFLKHQSQAKLKVNEQLVQFAIKICKEIRDKTISLNEGDYPCQCGGCCEKDFVSDGRC